MWAIYSALEQNPQSIFDYALPFMEIGQLSDDRCTATIRSVFQTCANGLETMEDKIDFLVFYRDNILPVIEEEYPHLLLPSLQAGHEEMKGTRHMELIIDVPHSTPSLAFLKELPESMEGQLPYGAQGLEPGKMLVLCRSTWPEEDVEWDSPFALCGDAMLMLPRELMADTFEEARYLVLVNRYYTGNWIYIPKGYSVNPATSIGKQTNSEVILWDLDISEPLALLGVISNEPRDNALLTAEQQYYYGGSPHPMEILEMLSPCFGMDFAGGEGHPAAH